MRKKPLILLQILLMGFCVSSCDPAVIHHDCNVYESIYVENDEFIFFPSGVYNKKSKKFYVTKELDDSYYFDRYKEYSQIEIFEDYYKVTNAYNENSTFSFRGKMIETNEQRHNEYQEYSFIKEGFGSNYMGDYPRHEEELNEIESAIYEYAKSKSVGSLFSSGSYFIEGKCKEEEECVYFYVNVYNGSSWKGGSLLSRHVVSSTLNKINKNNLEIDELDYMDKCAIKAFNENSISFYSKIDDCLKVKSRETETVKTISKCKRDSYYYDCGNLFLINNDSIFKPWTIVDYSDIL